MNIGKIGYSPAFGVNVSSEEKKQLMEDAEKETQRIFDDYRHARKELDRCSKNPNAEGCNRIVREIEERKVQHLALEVAKNTAAIGDFDAWA